jgi:hypothetical protein
VIEPEIKKGFVYIERQWKAGDVIELNLPMPARRVLANDNVAADVNKVAVERGPIVYCAEGADNDGNVMSMVLQDNAMLTAEYQDNLLNGITTIICKVDGAQDITLIPYYAWANRGKGQMAVWLARGESNVQQAQEEQTKIVIDVNKTAEPISKYIYGQFIEHLGRCIYGGMWAEMLEDRKFYYPIKDEYKPWGTDSAPRWNAGQYK